MQSKYSGLVDPQLQEQLSVRLLKRLSIRTALSHDTSNNDESRFTTRQSFFRPVQQLAQRISTHPDFEIGIIVLIASNCLTLALYDPIAGEGAGRNVALGKIELVFNAAFTIEMVLRIIALGGVLGYLRNSWNIFDGVMVLVGYTQFLPTGASQCPLSYILRPTCPEKCTCFKNQSV